MSSSPNGPYVNAALLCERTLQEKDGVISVIRVVDTITHGVPPGNTGARQIPIGLTALITFRSGDYVGSKTFSIRIVGPDGMVAGSQAFPIVFNGGRSGPSVLHPLAGRTFVPAAGDYWFEVYLDEDLMTKIPLRVNVQEQPALMSKMPMTDTPSG